MAVKCKVHKGKRFAKRVGGKCVSYGQKGKCKNPPCANAESRKKWRCRGKKSVG